MTLGEGFFVGGVFFFKILFIFREREREEERERNFNWLPLARALTRDQTCNPGRCLGWEWNWWPFTLGDTQAIEPQWSGLDEVFIAPLLIVSASPEIS